MWEAWLFMTTLEFGKTLSILADTVSFGMEKV